MLDDRFILKQMKKAEVESFVEIADGYFNHLRKAFDENVIVYCMLPARCCSLCNIHPWLVATPKMTKIACS